MAYGKMGMGPDVATKNVSRSRVARRSVRSHWHTLAYLGLIDPIVAKNVGWAKRSVPIETICISDGHAALCPSYDFWTALAVNSRDNAIIVFCLVFYALKWEFRPEFMQLTGRLSADTSTASDGGYSAQRQTLETGKRVITKWIEQNQQAHDRHTRIIADLKAQTSVDFAMLTVVINAVGDLFSKVKRNS